MAMRRWSSLVARLAHNQEVAGSNPAPAMIVGPSSDLRRQRVTFNTEVPKRIGNLVSPSRVGRISGRQRWGLCFGAYRETRRPGFWTSFTRWLARASCSTQRGEDTASLPTIPGNVHRYDRGPQTRCASCSPFRSGTQATRHRLPSGWTSDPPSRANPALHEHHPPRLPVPEPRNCGESGGSSLPLDECRYV